MKETLIKEMLKKNKELHKEFSRQYKFLGSGKFLSSYYDEEKNLVYKVFKLSVITEDKHGSRLTEYPDFVFEKIYNIKDSKKIKTLINELWKTSHDWAKFCMKNNDRFKHLPKVYDIYYYPEAFGFAYSTELLVSMNKYSCNKLDYLFAEGINACFYNRHHYNKNFLSLFNPNDFSMTQDSYKKRLRYVNTKELNKLSNIIYKKFSATEIDLHSQNFMFRKEDDFLIVNDPLY